MMATQTNRRRKSGERGRQTERGREEERETGRGGGEKL